MRNLISVFVLAAMILAVSSSTPAMATLDWKLVPFDSIVCGALSYDVSGDNVVVSGTAFRDTLGSTLSVQKIGGDGVNNPVVGNFGFFGAFNYTDDDNVFAWAQSIANAPLAIEIGAHPLDFGAFSDYFALDARDMPGVDYLTASFAEMGAWGCTEIAPNIWMDIAVDPSCTLVAISIVIDGFVLGSYPDLDLSVVPGDLDGEIPGEWRASGFRVAEIPEPTTMCLLGLGGLLLGRRKA